MFVDILDIKPANMEELTEVITAAEFHPSHSHEFVYSISKGSIRLCDMRASALCDEHCKGVFFVDVFGGKNDKLLSASLRGGSLLLLCLKTACQALGRSMFATFAYAVLLESDVDWSEETVVYCLWMLSFICVACQRA